MIKSGNVTLSEIYFMKRFRANTLLAAVEHAAVQEMELALLEEHFTLPIDVARIANRRNIEIQSGLSLDHCLECRLVPKQNGFIAQLKAQSSELKKRTTLAHEVGHTLFYSDTGERPRHQVGVLDKNEIVAEERICNLFARALLMPLSCLEQMISSNRAESAAHFLKNLDDMVRKFQVSFPALILRLADVKPVGLPYVILHLRFKENAKTGSDPKLRVETCATTASANNLYIWRNRSAEGLNLQSPLQLFDAWRSELGPHINREPGKHTWTEVDGLTKIIGNLEASFVEVVNVSVFRQGRWKLEAIPMKAASFLYAPNNPTDRDVNIITVLSPLDSSSLSHQLTHKET